MTYLDSTIIVAGLHYRHPDHNRCIAYLTRNDTITSNHALAESFSALTGSYRMRNVEVARALKQLARAIPIEPITTEDYLRALDEVQSRAVMGALIYDALHATVARRLGVADLCTLNVADFTHLACDLNISTPSGHQ